MTRKTSDSCPPSKMIPTAGSSSCYETKIPGNGNEGHTGAEFGTELPTEEKEALLEYLKTF